MMVIKVLYYIPTMLTLSQLMTIAISLILFLLDFVSSIPSAEHLNNDHHHQRHHKGVVDSNDRQQDLLLSKFHRMSQQPIIMTGSLHHDDRIISTTTTTTDNTEQNDNDDEDDDDRFRILLIDDDDLIIQQQNEIIDSSNSLFHRGMTIITNVTTTTGCVRNQKELEIAIINAPNNSVIPTNINICKENIFIDASIRNKITKQRGIHVINKFINFRCIINTNKKCIIDARGMSRHMFIMNSIITFNRITFRNGYETQRNYNDALGGSLYISGIESNIIIINYCDFINNIVKYGSGGAIHCYDNCNIKLNHVKMINNTASLYGGSIDVAIMSDGSDAIQMTNVIFQNNIAEYGAAVYFGTDSNVQMINITFVNNTVYSEGGAVYSNGTVVMTNVIFTNNTSYRYGGAAFFNYGSVVQMMNVSYINNIAETFGGAVVANGNSVMTNVLFKYNTATFAGALFTGGNTTMINATMSYNEAYISGGAILFFGRNNIITNSLLHSNNARSFGGAVAAYYSTIELNNVVLTNNSAINGTLFFGSSKANLMNSKISGSIVDVDECDILLGLDEFFSGNFNESESRLNLRPSPPPRAQQQKQIKQESFITVSQQSSSGEQPIKTCVTTYTALRKQVRICNNTLTMDPCVINVCKARIQMNKISGGPHPINLSSKNILINCQRASYKRCMIDGQGFTNFFYGSNVAVTFIRMIFSNGYSSDSGGALDLANNSFVNLLNCSFVNNSATTGAAIIINDTALYMTGAQSSFINNTGNSPALVGYSSDLNFYDTLFEGNSITQYGNGIFLFDSTINLYNTTFSASKMATDYDCNVFVDFGNGVSCLDVSSITK